MLSVLFLFHISKRAFSLILDDFDRAIHHAVPHGPSHDGYKVLYSVHSYNLFVPNERPRPRYYVERSVPY